MKFSLAFILSLILGSTYSQPGRPYAIWEDQSLGQYRYVRLDASTGGKTNISVIPGIAGFVAGNATAYNPLTDHYHFTAINGSGNPIFYTLDRVTGTILYNPFMTHTVVGIEFNPTDSLLYGVRVNATSYELVTIDPATGLDTMVFPLATFNGYVASSFCIDTQQQLYIFKVLMGSNYVLYAINLSTGAVLASNLFPDNVVGLRYSCYEDAVFGLWDNNGFYTLEKVDPLTGLHTTIDTLLGVQPGFVAESYSVNPLGKYTFRGFDASNNFGLFTVDLSSGSVVVGANTSDNAVGFEEPGACGVTTSIKNFAQENSFVLFPNPAGEKLFIKTENPSAKKISIRDLAGRILMERKFLNGENEISTDVGFLSPGIYVVSVLDSVGSVYCKKFIRE